MPWRCSRDASTRSKYAIVFESPSLKEVDGSQSSTARARVMSGRRWRGSSCGSGRSHDPRARSGQFNRELGKLAN